MDLFRLTIAGKGGGVRVAGSSAAFRFGTPSDPERALANLEIGDVADEATARTFTVGLGSLLSGAAGVFAVNGIMGWLSGSFGSLPDVLVSHFDPLENVGAKAVFAACFVTHATIVEIGKRYLRRRGDRFFSDAIARGVVGAGGDDHGRWVVGPAGLFEGETANWTFTALALWARNRIAILTPSEFSLLEARLAGHGCVLRKYRMVGEGRGVITTQRFGKLHSVDGQSAYKVMSFGETLVEEWYRDGQRIPMPAMKHAPTTDDAGTPGNRVAAEGPEVPSLAF